MYKTKRGITMSLKLLEKKEQIKSISSLER